MKRALLVVVVLCACKDEPTQAAQPLPPRSLGNQLVHEAAHRPRGPVTVEIALARFAQVGATLEQVKQYVAKTTRASYCVGGQTREGLAVAVCELESAEAAAASRAFVLHALPDVPGRRIVVHGAMTLITTAADRDDESARDLVERTFLGL